MRELWITSATENRCSRLSNSTWITAIHRGHLSPLLPYVFPLLCLLAFWLFSLLLLSSPNVLFFFSLKRLHLLHLSDLRREECSSLVCHDFSVCTGRGVEPQGGASRLTDKYRWKWCRSSLCHWGHTHTHMYSGSSPAMPLWERGERSTASVMGFTTGKVEASWPEHHRHITWLSLISIFAFAQNSVWSGLRNEENAAWDEWRKGS